MKLNTLIVLLFFLTISFNYAQTTYPKVVSKNEQNFLMINPDKEVDLKTFGNEKCLFSIIAHNKTSIILEFNQPSKLTSKGRCASGEEKGFIYFELDDNVNLITSESYLVESCLWSIEIIDTNRKDSNKIKYVSENYQSLNTFTTTIDLQKVIVIKEEKKD